VLHKRKIEGEEKKEEMKFNVLFASQIFKRVRRKRCQLLYPSNELILLHLNRDVEGINSFLSPLPSSPLPSLFLSSPSNNCVEHNRNYIWCIPKLYTYGCNFCLSEEINT
jgi:hypothetical protein